VAFSSFLRRCTTFHFRLRAKPVRGCSRTNIYTKNGSLPNQQRAPYKSFTRRRNFEYLIPEDNDSHGSREIVNSVKKNDLWQQLTHTAVHSLVEIPEVHIITCRHVAAANNDTLLTDLHDSYTPSRYMRNSVRS